MRKNRGRRKNLFLAMVDSIVLSVFMSVSISVFTHMEMYLVEACSHARIDIGQSLIWHYDLNQLYSPAKVLVTRQ